MPIYQFECQSCGHVHSVVMKMSEYDAYPKTCQQKYDNHPVGGAHLTACGGELIQDYSARETQNFILQGRGWTPKFGPVNRG